MLNIRYEFIMSQIQHIRDMNETEKTKISLVFYEGCQGPCVFKVCKNRNLSDVYQALMEIRHPNLAIVYDCVYENGNTYVLEEYIPGKTLMEILAEKGTFSEEETTRIMIELCGGLETMHQHEPPIIHNDIKASNIMIREDGVVKLFDFDISRIYKEGSFKNTKLMGTYEYAAPEHYGFGQSEPCTDIYSLGITMHEMLTGVGLDHNHNVTYQGCLAKVVKKCVEIDRKKRYASASLLRADLEKVQKPNRHMRGIVLAGICGLCLLLLCIGIGLCHYLETKREMSHTVGNEGGSEVIGNDIEGKNETEEGLSTEDDLNTEDGSQGHSTEGDDDKGTEDTENSGTEVDSDNSVVPPNNVGNTVDSEMENDEITVVKKPIHTVYNVQGTFLAMEAWTDGTFVFLEEVDGNCYLRTFDGKEKLLEGVQAAYGAKLACDPYTNKMYLWLSHYHEQWVYYVTEDLETEFITKYNVSGKTGCFLGFFSNGTLTYDGAILNSNDWTPTGEYCKGYGALKYIIHDKLYLMEHVFESYGISCRFLEFNTEGQVTKTFPLEKGMIWNSFAWDAVYNNSKATYFFCDKEGLTYLVRFDGKEYTMLACVEDYEGGPNVHFKNLYVTDKVFRCYSDSQNAILEFSLE